MWSAYQVEPEKRPCECPFHQATLRPRVSSPRVCMRDARKLHERGVARRVVVGTYVPRVDVPAHEGVFIAPVIGGAMVATGMRVSRQAVSVLA